MDGTKRTVRIGRHDRATKERVMGSTNSIGIQGFVAAVAAVAITYAMGLGFVGATRAAGTEPAAQVVSALAAASAGEVRTVRRSGRGFVFSLIM
jgi:hypothetical protein